MTMFEKNALATLTSKKQ